MLTFSSRHYKHILLLLNSNNNLARLIGGCVRDALLNKASHDIDIATTLFPEQVSNLLLKYNIKVIPTGIKFGTVTAIYENEKFEITTLRKDIESNGRHSKVSFTNDFKEDAARRDFTINALSYCPFENKIYDYFNGLEDLKYQCVKFIGDPLERIKEDYLRILRFFRFSALYSKELDVPGIKACEELKDGLKILSRERIKQEIDKLLIAEKAPKILQQMQDSNILSIIFPIKLYNRKFLEQAIKFSLHTLTKYALLFYNLSFKLPDLLKLKFSRQESICILSIINFIDQEKISEFDFKKIWLEKVNYTEYLYAAAIANKIDLDNVEKFINKYDLLKKPAFPLTGNDLLDYGIINQDIGKELENLKSLWIESNFIMNKKELLICIKEGKHADF